jgi:hypothetical protein
LRLKDRKGFFIRFGLFKGVTYNLNKLNLNFVVRRDLAMLERKHQKVVPASAFVKRMFVYAGFAMVLIVAALTIGVAGYHWIAGFTWIDAVLNASMILSGMGPVGPLTSVGAKVFASCYALFSGIVFIAVMGIVFTPIVHRVIHIFHVED